MQLRRRYSSTINANEPPPSDDSDNELTQSTSNAVEVENNNLNFPKFVQSKNEWSKTSLKFSCCSNECINTNNPIGNCIERNGFGKIINDEDIEYTNCLEEERGKNGGKRGIDCFFWVIAENPFRKPQNCFNYSLFYFEITCIFEDEKEKCVVICLNAFMAKDSIRLYAQNGRISKEGSEGLFKIDNFSFKNNDVFGCGIVYPPNNKVNEFPYVFYTQNGKEIGKAALLTRNDDSYRPCIGLQRCSIKANFGNNLETKPFIYDISKQSLPKEFYRTSSLLNKRFFDTIF
uniref:Uncharacterized protein n=1 Tax=Meloidogyne incognita TaxID=6306 RepID=A0A914N4S1_MELIC